MELVVGATGYIGERLIERLVSEDRPVRALARDPSAVTLLPGVDPVGGNLMVGEGLGAALDGVATAYYLVHSMEAADDDDFAERDRRMARRFGKAARDAGVKRIVYLGGIAPEGRVSTHLGSRLEVEQILLGAVPDSTALRASIVIGARSSSFRVLVRLVERLPVLPMPGWGANCTQPIDERDVIEYLARTPSVPAAAGRALDVVGPDLLSYGEMMARIAELMGVGRPSLAIGASLTSPASAVVAALTGQPVELVRPLMESLASDLLPRDPDEAARLYGLRPRGFERAVEHALAEWETAEPLGAR
ncbi:MAG: NAD(P)H-binding protein [Actinomycetota bacterium]|nr:NAD(P)H-binding protein [Actinomycetota bacterium]